MAVVRNTEIRTMISIGAVSVKSEYAGDAKLSFLPRGAHSDRINGTKITRNLRDLLKLPSTNTPFE